MKYIPIRGWVIGALQFLHVNQITSSALPDAANNGVNQGLRYDNVGVNHAPYDPNPQLTNFGKSTLRVPKGY